MDVKWREENRRLVVTLLVAEIPNIMSLWAVLLHWLLRHGWPDPCCWMPQGMNPNWTCWTGSCKHASIATVPPKPTQLLLILSPNASGFRGSMCRPFIPIEQLIHLNGRARNYRAAVLQANHLTFTCIEHEVKVWPFLQHNIFPSLQKFGVFQLFS